MGENLESPGNRDQFPAGIDIESGKTLSEITIHLKYAAFLESKKRRETFKEIIERNKQMHMRKYPQIEKELFDEAYDLVLQKKILPSMRSLQFAGIAIERNHAKIYNCCFLHIENTLSFSESMFLLLSGTGVGYSIQKCHVEKLPVLYHPKEDQSYVYVIPDDIEGWADSIKEIMTSYMPNSIDGERRSSVIFDYTKIRAKGMPLKTSGGKAPGPGPLKLCHERIINLLKTLPDGKNISPINCHDIMGFISDSVLSGGIRRSSMISLFSIEDEEMMKCKSGNWFETHPWRACANNSVVLERGKVTPEQFNSVMTAIESSKAGEPGVFWTSDIDIGTNPCGEVSLRSCQFCNLTEINGSNVIDQEDLNKRAKYASFLGTLQTGYTDFSYLRPKWRIITEEDALLGVSITGIATGKVLDLDLEEAAQSAKDFNGYISKLIDINPAKRVTCIKPGGTTSLVFGCSSGIHPWHSEYYFRRIRINNEEPIYGYLKEKFSNLLEPDLQNPNNTSVFTTVIKSPPSAITRSEGSIQFLERVKKVHSSWIKGGYRSGVNHHNVSATVNVADNEWAITSEWLWSHREDYCGIAVFPHFGSSYKQAPHEDCTEEDYVKYSKILEDMDLTQIKEERDNTDFISTILACSGMLCEK
jgi:ribonucleoside-triphosphate reductase